MKNIEYLMWLIGGAALGLLTLMVYTKRKIQSAIKRLGVFRFKFSGINHYSDKDIGFYINLKSDKKETMFKIKLYLLLIKIVFEYKNGYLEKENSIDKRIKIGL